MRPTTVAPLILIALALGTLPAAGQTPDFRWHGRLAPGKRVEVKGVNGDVHAVATTGAEVVVTAAKHARRTGASPWFLVCPPNRRWSIFPSGVRLKGKPQCSSSMTASMASRHIRMAAGWSTR